MNEMERMFLEAAGRMGVKITINNANPVGPTNQPVIDAQTVPDAPPPTPALTAPQPVAGPIPVVDPPEMKPEWEKEIDQMIQAHGGRLEIRLQSGTMIRVVEKPGSAPDAVEVGYDTFKRLSRAAAILNGRVVNVLTKAQADAETKDRLEKGLGFWASPSVFIEVDKQVDSFRSHTVADFGVIAAPRFPPVPPPIMASAWITLSAGDIVENVPMRLGSGKVIGSLIMTKAAPLYARTARDTEHKLNLPVDWAMAGGYTIEREIYDKYLTNPATIIKIVRGDHIYLTTSDWIQKYGGSIRRWGTECVVMPLTGSFWLVVNRNGEPI